jgi:hypothetical protein
MTQRAYDLVRTMFEKPCAEMSFVGKGYPRGGAGVILVKKRV